MKDARFIGKFFKDKKGRVGLIILSHRLFFVDGAANVQKSGEILCVNYPRALCFCGGEQ